MTTPDHLFRDRLAGLQKSPPPNAWNRVTNGLQRNRRRKIWSRLAAILILIALVGITVVSLKKDSKPALPSKPVVEKPSPLMAQTPASQADTNAIAETENSGNPVAQNTINNETVRARSKTVSSHENPVAVDNHAAITSEKTTLAATDIQDTKAEIDLPAEPASLLTQEPMAEATSAKIIYTADDVNARFRRKKEIPTDTIAKPHSGLQKVVALAYGFKNDNTILGDLRHMKNELFSIPGKKSTRVQ